MVACSDCFHVSLLNVLCGFYVCLFSAQVEPEQTERVFNEVNVLCKRVTRKTVWYGGDFLKWFVMETLTGHFSWEQVDDEELEELEDIEPEREVGYSSEPDTPVAESPRVQPRKESCDERPNFRYNFRKRKRAAIIE